MIDRLEDRRLFSFGISNGALNIGGTPSGDEIILAWRVRSADNFTLKVSVNGVIRNFDWVRNSSPWNQVSISGGNGHDQITGAVSADDNDFVTSREHPIYVIMNGGHGDDRIGGTDSGDRMLGGSGNDFLDAFEGSDVLVGQDGNDTLYGGYGADVLDAREISSSSPYVDLVVPDTGGGFQDNVYLDRAPSSSAIHDDYWGDGNDSITFSWTY